MNPTALEPAPRILGGVEARPHEFPYHVHLSITKGTSNYFDCGGVILSTVFILTTASCVKSDSARKSSVIVTAGDHDRSKDEKNLQRRFVSRYEIHENYRSRRFVHKDIALLVLSEPLIFNEYVKSIPYPMTKTEFNGTAVAIGWGKTLNYTTKYKYPSALQKVILSIIPRQECKAIYARIGKQISNQMICVGAPAKFPCGGDQGGALLCTESNTNATVLCGVFSNSYKCGKHGIPSQYTEVSNYGHWIQKSIQKLGNCSSEEFQCLSKCIPLSQKCNGESDCENGEDEAYCDNLESSLTSKHKCQLGEFNCYLNSSPLCINSYWVGDGQTDCENGEDERHYGGWTSFGGYAGGR